MSKDSKHKDAAWEFIKYWTNEECNKARIGTELPVLNSVVESEGIMDQKNMRRFTPCWSRVRDIHQASFLMDSWSEGFRKNLSFNV